MIADLFEHHCSRNRHLRFVSGGFDLALVFVVGGFSILDLAGRNSNQTRFKSAVTNINIVSLHKAKEPNPKSLT